MNLRADIPLVERVAAELRAYMGEDFDDDTFIDSLDGETDFADIADALLKRDADDAAMVAALDSHIAEVKTRRDRLDGRRQGYTRALQRLLEAAGIRKLERPLATVSLRKGSEYVRIVHEEDVPSQLYREKVTRSIDKAAISKLLKAGEAVPGCELLRSDDSVMVRRS